MLTLEALQPRPKEKAAEAKAKAEADKAKAGAAADAAEAAEAAEATETKEGGEEAGEGGEGAAASEETGGGDKSPPGEGSGRRSIIARDAGTDNSLDIARLVVRTIATLACERANLRRMVGEGVVEMMRSIMLNEEVSPLSRVCVGFGL